MTVIHRLKSQKELAVNYTNFRIVNANVRTDTPIRVTSALHQESRDTILGLLDYKPI